MFEQRGSIRRAARGIAQAAFLLIATVAMFMSAADTAAQEDATPESAATPVTAASPEPLTPEESRSARLGGTLDEVLAAYGPPDWTNDGLVGYNAIELGGVETITMVYYDSLERVRSYLLVYLERPDELKEMSTIAAVVADVAPRDGECDDEPLEESNLGDTVFACRSEALQGVFTADDLLALELVGEDGTFNYAVDPTDDQYFEIAVRLGTDGLPEPPTPAPTPSPEPPAPLDDRYPPVEDASALVDGSLDPGTPVSFPATVIEIRLAEVGTTIIMEATGEDGSSVIVAAENQDDLAGIFPGEVWTIYGVYSGHECGESGCVATVYVMRLG